MPEFPHDEFRLPIEMLPRGYWVGAISAALVAAAGLGWACLGSVATKVYGQGLLVTAGESILAVEPERTGILREIRVKPGDRVKAGDLIARLELNDLDLELRAARLTRDQSHREYVKVTESSEQERVRRRRAVAEQRSSLEGEIARLDASAARLGKQVANGEALFSQGLARAADLEALRRDLDRTIVEAAKSRAAIMQAQADLVEFEDRLAAHVRAVEQERARQGERVRDLAERFARGTEIRAPQDATVIEVRVGPGDVLQPGRSIATLSVADPAAGPELVAFLDIAQGLRVKPGMAAHVIPSTVKKEEFGSIRSEVVALHPRPASESEVDVLLRNPDLARRFMSAGPPIVSRLRLSAAATPSGFAWWSGAGPPFEIRRGTICLVEIDVREQAPITLVLPLLRQLLGT